MPAVEAVGHQNWKPTASAESLQQAARLRRVIHQWMTDQGILEVITPPISAAANSDPHVESLLVASASGSERNRYLHTSPEFAMKRILCAYPETDIYQIATVFRAGEQGRYHVCQFSMLEWYRVGMDHKQLMQDTETLLEHIWEAFGIYFNPVVKRSYCQEVYARLGRWPDELDGVHVRDYFLNRGRSFPHALEDDMSASLDLFMDEFVLPEFDQNCVTFLSEYPISQAALARVGMGQHGLPVAERFEVFVGHIELANGFHELNDELVQRNRFENDLRTRERQSQSRAPMDEHLLAALDAGLPDCAGIALGLERLHMVLGEHTHIDQVRCFSDENA